MIKIAMTFLEAKILHKILREHLVDLTNETTAHAIAEFAEPLQSEENFVRKMVDHLEGQGIGIPAEVFGGYSE